MSDSTVIVTEQPTTVTVDDSDTSVSVSNEAVAVITAAEQGPVGPPGPSGDLNFTQVFNNVSSVTVNHNLGKYPSVTVFDSAGDECEGDVDYTNINSLTVSFSAPFSGEVVCN